MRVAEKYHLQREIGWSDEAEVHLGPPNEVHREPIAVKIRHGMGGPPRPDGNRERFLKACAAQEAAVKGGCRQIAPIWETGYEGDNAYYVTRQYPRSLASLIEGHVALEAAMLQRITSGALTALEELRDRCHRAHGNLKATNIFLEGKTAATGKVVLSDLARPEAPGTPGEDCNALGTVLFQLVREHVIRDFDWPVQPGPEWERLGRQGDAWREYCNLLLSPHQQARPDALEVARAAFKDMRHLHVAIPGSPSGDETSRRQAAGGMPTGLVVTALVVAAGIAGAVLTGNHLKLIRWMRGGEAVVDPPLVDSGAVSPTPPVVAPVTPTPAASSAPLTAYATPATVSSTPTPEPTVEETPMTTPPPAVAETTPPPTPVANSREKWIGYIALLQQFQGSITAPDALEHTDTLNTGLARLKDNISFLPVKDEPSVDAFVRRLPPRLEAAGDQPDLPPNLWTKEGTSRQDDLQTFTYQWGHTGYRVVFNRVNNANGPAFYLASTTVSVQFGAALAKMAEADGKGPLSGGASVKGPVSWEFVRGAYAPRASWMLLDSINSGYYANAGRPTAESPLNGLSGIDALRLARAAGAMLPTVSEWAAVLGSPSGQQWIAQWRTFAKVRSPQWSTLARQIQAGHVTGAKLPNDQCYGDRADLSAVTQTPDQNLFFEPVTARMLKGYAHLIGNAGQYVVDDARNPTKYYVAGGSAEAAPAVFQALTSPTAVLSPFLSAADVGLRLAVPAKGSGSEKSPAFDQLKADVSAELARLDKMP